MLQKTEEKYRYDSQGDCRRQKEDQSRLHQSLRWVAREAGLKRESVQKVVVQSGWKSFRRTKVPLISTDGRERRATRAAGLVNVLKLKGRDTIIFFSDEKTFMVFNPQNDQWIRITEEDDEDDDQDHGDNNNNNYNNWTMPIWVGNPGRPPYVTPRGSAG